MSARPRPVTATFPPPAFAERPQGSYSLSTSTSTASLLSVLDHGSCASLEEDLPNVESSGPVWCGHETAKLPSGKDSSLFIRYTACPQTVASDKTKRSNIQQNRQRTKSANHERPTSPVAQSPTLQNEEQGDRQLSAWEKWILQKAKGERDAAEEKLQKQKEIEKQVEEERVERERKKAEAAGKIQAWIDEYDASVKQKRRLQVKRDKAEQELKEEKKLELLNKAKDKFQEWLEKKNTEATERCVEERERKRKEKLEKKTKQQKNEAAYNAWCEKAKNRPRTAPNSFGYCAGNLRGYYDTNAYPAPSYYNPVPWDPVDIPQQKPCTKKKPVKNRSNRERYF